MERTYLIDYTVRNQTGELLKGGSMRVYRSQSDLHAKIKFGEYLRRLFTAAGVKIEMSRCVLDTGMDFESFLKGFGK